MGTMSTQYWVLNRVSGSIFPYPVCCYLIPSRFLGKQYQTHSYEFHIFFQEFVNVKYRNAVN
jgi:hypothetical protein